MDRTRKRGLWILLSLMVAVWFVMMWLGTDGRYVLVESNTGRFDLTGYDFDHACYKVDGAMEYVEGALLAPDQFDGADVRLGRPASWGAATTRVTLLLPPGRLYGIEAYTHSFASRIYVNGKLLLQEGTPGLNREESTAGRARVFFTAAPEAGAVQIVQQSDGFAHKDGFSGGAWNVGDARSIQVDVIRRFSASAMTVGAYLMLALTYLVLFVLLPGYKANLHLSGLCLVFALRQGFSGVKPLAAMLPWIDWTVGFRIEYLTVTAALGLLVLAYHALFPRALPRWYRFMAYGVAAAFSALYLIVGTRAMSYTMLPLEGVCAFCAVFALARLWRMWGGLGLERRSIVVGLWFILLAVVADTAFYNFSILLPFQRSGMVDGAMLLCSLVQLAAMLSQTMMEYHGARALQAQLAMEKAALVERNMTLEQRSKRAEALLKRAEQVPGQVIAMDRLTLDTAAGRAFADGSDLMLSPREFALLCVLAQQLGQVVARETLYEAAWNHPMAGDGNALKIAMSRLRKKLEGSPIKLDAVRGEGYRVTVKPL